MIARAINLPAGITFYTLVAFKGQAWKLVHTGALTRAHSSVVGFKARQRRFSFLYG